MNDTVLARLEAGDLRFRQKAGAHNALGLVKFVFPSTYAVYLHSTPTPEVFQKSRRDFSHGCIRVEAPDVNAAMNGTKQLRVKLLRPVPVLVLYRTAVVVENGDVHFFDDIYGLDKSLERSLAAR